MLQAKIAWVTGGGSGIGEAGALALAEAGATIILSGRGSEKLEAVGAKSAPRRQGGHRAARHHKRAEVAESRRRIVARHGRIDILVNRRGVTCRTALEESDRRELRPDRRTNLNGTLYAIEAVLPAMRAQRGRLRHQCRVWRALPRLHDGAAYNASKFAVLADHVAQRR